MPWQFQSIFRLNIPPWQWPNLCHASTGFRAPANNYPWILRRGKNIFLSSLSRHDYAGPRVPSAPSYRRWDPLKRTRGRGMRARGERYKEGRPQKAGGGRAPRRTEGEAKRGSLCETHTPDVRNTGITRRREPVRQDGSLRRIKWNPSKREHCSSCVGWHYSGSLPCISWPRE